MVLSVVLRYFEIWQTLDKHGWEVFGHSLGLAGLEFWGVLSTVN